MTWNETSQAELDTLQERKLRKQLHEMHEFMAGLSKLCCSNGLNWDEINWHLEEIEYLAKQTKNAK